MAGTNFERNASLERIMVRVQTYASEMRKLVGELDANSIPRKLSIKSESITKSMLDIQQNIKAKERSE